MSETDGGLGRYGAILTGRPVKAVIASVVVAVLGYAAFSIWAGWREVAGAFHKVGWSGFAILFSLSLLNYFLRFCRWQIYMRVLGYPMPPLQSLVLYVTGFALTTTPGKAGEMLRGVFLKLRGVPFLTSASGFFNERLSDLLAIVLMTLPGLAAYPQGQPVVAAAFVGMGVVALFLSREAWLVGLANWMGRQSSRLFQMGQKVMELLIGARSCYRPPVFAASTALSIVAWCAEGYAFHLTLQWLGLETSISFAMFAYAIAALAGALSFLPGGLGGTEAVMIGLLLLRGAPEADAVAATIIMRLTTLWFAVVIGALAVTVVTTSKHFKLPTKPA